MRELLERWAKLEPDKCQVVSGHYLVDGRIVYLLRTDTIEVDALMITQWAVQKAIIAREWYFEIFCNPTKCTVGVLSSMATEDNPAEALLGAYLAALEGRG